MPHRYGTLMAIVTVAATTVIPVASKDHTDDRSGSDHVECAQFRLLRTLIDWERGIAAVLSPWARGEGLDLTDEQLLRAYADNEAAVEREIPTALYPEVIAAAFRRTGDKLGRSVSEDWATRLGNSVPDWPAFPDSADALARLATHYHLIIVSNVNRDGFAGSNKQLRGDFAAIITARMSAVQAGRESLPRSGRQADRSRRAAQRTAACSAKPLPRSCRRQARRPALGVDQPASRSIGLGRGRPEPSSKWSYDLEVQSMAAFADAVDSAFTGRSSTI